MEMRPLNSTETSPDDKILKVDKEEITPKKTKRGRLQTILSSFFKTSTIPAVTLVYQRISIVWKILWVLIAIVGLSVSIYQAVELITNYLEYPTNLVEIEKINRTVKFPSLTLCTTNIVNWKAAFDIKPSFIHNVDNRLESTNASSEFERRLLIEYTIIDELYKLNKTERDQILFRPKDWFKGCLVHTFGGGVINCTSLHKDFLVEVHSPYYGACITINAGFSNKYQFKEDSKTKITLLTETPDTNDSPYLPHFSGLLLSLHAPGSAPVIPFNKRLTIIPGSWLQLTTTVYDFHRLPHPYASNCTEQNDPVVYELNQFSPYSDDVQPNVYDYSREECMATCFQYLLVLELNCINPFLDTNDDIESSGVPLCTEQELNGETLRALEEFCGEGYCQKRCHELLYDWTPVIQKVPKDDSYLRDFLDYVVPNSARDKNEYFEDIVTYISIQMESTIHVVGTEVPKLSVADVFGSIGGNLGLWVGISVLSIFEVFELLAHLISYTVYRIRKFCFKKRSSK